MLAKTLFLAQLGKYTLREGDKTTDYVGSIAETFAHGGRTNFILPFNDTNNEVLAAFEGGKIGKTAELKSRIAATHSATQRKVDVDLSIKSESIEEKPKFSQVGKIFSNQYGMNLAIGGDWPGYPEVGQYYGKDVEFEIDYVRVYQKNGGYDENVPKPEKTFRQPDETGNYITDPIFKRDLMTKDTSKGAYP